MSKLGEILRTLYPHTVVIDHNKKSELKRWLRENHIYDFEIFLYENRGKRVMVVGFETEESHFLATMRYFD